MKVFTQLSWTSTSLDEIGDIFCGQSVSEPEVNRSGIGVVYVTGPEQWNGEHIEENKWTTSPRRVVPEGCIFITVKGAGVGKTFPGVAGAIGRDIYAYKPSQAVDAEFVHKAIRHRIAILVAEARGDIPGLSRDHLAEYALALPPLAEQRRIVAKLDALTARLTRARAELERVSVLAIKLRQAALIHAFSTLRLGENYKILSAAQACEKVQSGGTPKAGFSTRGVPFLKVYNINNQTVNFNYRPQYVSLLINSTELKKSVAYPGDVIMNIVGPPLGKVAIVPDDYPQWNVNQALAIFRPSELVSSEWLYYYLCSGESVQSIVGETRGIAGQVNISLSQCRLFPVPVPSQEVQAEVVDEIEAAFARADRLEAEAARARALLDRLEAAILAKAFRGELVPQDPADEPASVLLDRIRAERAAAPKPKRGRRSNATQV